MGCEPSGGSLESLVDERARANGLLGHGADRALARSAERAVDDHLAQGALEDRELLIIELRDE